MNVKLTNSHESLRLRADRQSAAARNDNGQERTYAALAADEVLAAVENLEDCLRLTDGPPGRRVPETLCLEIERLLTLFSKELRDAYD